MVGCNIVGGGRWISDGVGFYGGGNGFLVMVGCRCGCGGLCFMVV